MKDNRLLNRIDKNIFFYFQFYYFFCLFIENTDILGLGDIFDSAQTDTALASMMKYNYKSTMRDHANPWRIFSLNDEAGSVICVYPEHIKKPRIPVPYCEETMTGFEYSFAGLLFSRGMVDEGVKVVKAVRDRFDGKARNPWNEFECGNNYARAMASFALIPILSGFKFDLPHGHIGFKPYKEGDFSTFWSVDGAWGEYIVSADRRVLTVTEGEIALSSLGISGADKISSVVIDGAPVPYEYKNGCVSFAKTAAKHSIEILI